MADISFSSSSPSKSVRRLDLPFSVQKIIDQICREQSQPQPDANAIRVLASLGEEASLHILHIIAKEKIQKSLSGFIFHLAKKYAPVTKPAAVPYFSSPSKSPLSPSPHNIVTLFNSYTGRDQGPPCSPVRLQMASPSLIVEKVTFHGRELTDQLVALGELDFLKAFIILSYIGSKHLEDVLTSEDLRSLKDSSVEEFEPQFWQLLAERKRMSVKDRVKCNNLNSCCYVYHCHVSEDGSYIFKGPFSSKTRTHMQRILGDENVLLVKFAEEVPVESPVIDKIFKEGILVGLRLYQFFIFKDGGKEEKRKTSKISPVRSYFVRTESRASVDTNKAYVLSGKTINEARDLFMHARTVSSVEKYIARFSLILSKTIKLETDLANVHVMVIDDVYCLNQDGTIAHKENGEPRIHTDGTGFISEDIALMCPKNLFKGKHLNQSFHSKVVVDGRKSDVRVLEPPLLMQVRLFNNGCAIKGTFLVNRKLPRNTIVVRPSMIKVEQDGLSNIQTCNSLEVVTTSYKPKKARLSRSLIALLCLGGVPKDYFFDILNNTLEDAQNALSSRRAALNVAMRHGDMDHFIVPEMISSGIPMEEPYLKYRLFSLMSEEKNNLKEARLPIDESCYLMGTADPTGMLKRNEVCIILEDGQVSGKVIVYRNPGLHFGDVHVLDATYVKEMEDFVGNAKYGIFFPTIGPRSLADEMGGGDFDGDMFFISRNPQLLHWFKPCDPWVESLRGQDMPKKKPCELSAEELEDELLRVFRETRSSPCRTISEAADSWLSYMDRYLVLGDNCADEKARVKGLMLQLTDIYYESLDAPKSGKKIDVPPELKAKKNPHFMGRGGAIYKSTSILGQIYDKVISFQNEMPDIDIWTLPCFDDVDVPDDCLKLWEERYEKYRKEMTDALSNETEAKGEFADAVIGKYKQMLYGGPEYEHRTKSEKDILHGAVAIYRKSYENATRNNKISYCSFPWRIAGPVLLACYRNMQEEKSLVFAMSVAKELF